MGGGIISLVANGAQDVYLTADPQITYFKVIYRRYTNFAMETIEQAIDSAKPGGRYSVQVQRNGDLATKTALRIRLPAIRADALCNGTEKIAYVRRLGHALIRSIELKIGGMQIDKQYGVWMDIWWELTHDVSNERGYRNLIGDVPELTALRGREFCDNANEVVIPEYTLYIPMQFFYCRNYGLALPLIALQYHEVRLEIELEEICRLIVWTGRAPPNLGNFCFKDAGVMIDYVYLESGERRKYAQLGHEYLMEELQFSGPETVQFNCNATSNSQKFKLNYNHPTKEIVFAMKVGAFNGEANRSSFSGGCGKFLTYTHRDDLWETCARDYAAKNLAEGCVFINPAGLTDKCGMINGQPVHLCSEVHNPGFNDGQRVVVKLRNNNVGCEDKDIKCANEKGIRVYCYDTFFNNVDFHLFGNKNGVELFDCVSEATVLVSHSDGDLCSVSIEALCVRHSLDLSDLSVPVEAFCGDFRSNESRKYCVHKDVAVTQPNNYGLRLDGRGNPVLCGNIQLNGHDRFKVQEGSYFNYYQTQNHHTRTPADGINVYSFALHPEKLQPSGTTNLSRIDSTYLNLVFGDCFRLHCRLKLDLATNSLLYIYAFSYNILRVMSGMGGKAYSN
ncbi:MAG: NCLDV major capsid protein [Dasosvirus sp.]|uniref:NCLDV major capsid protein n=1 Tax=Dasosvirus sp. TaxID=2487764 RepID=A0A3G4ZVH3_9VIRU|nr:MAG: NCLDV major capsid protein [Dasosvirus sp.]